MFSKHSLCSVHNNDNPNRFCDFVKIASFRPDFQKGNTWSMGYVYTVLAIPVLVSTTRKALLGDTGTRNRVRVQ